MSSSNRRETGELFGEIASRIVELGNEIAEREPDSDLREIGSGLLAGAVQFWLYSHQPCSDPGCEGCAEVSSADKRLELLLQETRELAETSDYYHSPNDPGSGTA
jgi:hypothetical protein